jgi:predicted transcriptional regulator
MSKSEAQEIAAQIESTLEEPLSTALLSLDKALASQTQTYAFCNADHIRSAQLNIAQSSLNEVAKYAQSRLEKARASFKTGLQDAKELQKELGELDRRIRELKDQVRERWAVEYYTVRDEMNG